MKRAWPFAYALILLGAIGALNFITADDRQYSRLAESFLNGQLSLLPRPGNDWADTAAFGAQHFSALAPLPALLMIPFVWAGAFHLGLWTFLASVAVFSQCLLLAKKFAYGIRDACWFALAFCFGTSFIGVAALATSNHFAHVLAVLFLYLAIAEQEAKNRLWLVGASIGLALVTRAPAGLNILYFILAALLGAEPVRQRMANLLKLLLPFGSIVSLLCLYNFLRFGNPFESGYGYQVTGLGVPYAQWNVPGNSAGPALSLSHIPGHLWIFLFGLPNISAVGTSVLVMSPYLVYLCAVQTWDQKNKLIVLSSAAVLLAVLAFRSTGFEQVGYRFSLDFLPMIFWLMMRSRVELTGRFKSLIFLATVIDVSLTFYHLATGVDRRLALN